MHRVGRSWGVMEETGGMNVPHVTSEEMSTGFSIPDPLHVPLSSNGDSDGSSHGELLGVTSEEQQEVFLFYTGHFTVAFGSKYSEAILAGSMFCKSSTFHPVMGTWIHFSSGLLGAVEAWVSAMPVSCESTHR